MGRYNSVVAEIKAFREEEEESISLLQQSAEVVTESKVEDKTFNFSQVTDQNSNVLPLPLPIDKSENSETETRDNIHLPEFKNKSTKTGRKTSPRGSRHTKKKKTLTLTLTTEQHLRFSAAALIENTTVEAEALASLEARFPRQSLER